MTNLGIQEKQRHVEGQRENSLYPKDLGFPPIKNKDDLHAIEEAQLREHLELLLQVSRSNKSIKVRFHSERAAQEFVDCEITLNGNNFALWSNAQRRVRAPIHGVHPSISDATLEYELIPYFGGVLNIKREAKQYKTKQYPTCKEESMSTSQAEINLQKDNSDSSSSNLYLQLDRAYIVSYVRHV